MNDEEADNVMTGIGCLFSLAVLPIAIVYTGFALSYLWLWLYLALFHASLIFFPGKYNIFRGRKLTMILYEKEN